MAYQKQDWRDLPDETTPISAERLIHMEDGIYEASMTEVVDSMENPSSNMAPSVNSVKEYVDETHKFVPLWTGSELPAGKTYPLSSNIYKYRFVVIVAEWGNKITIPIIEGNTYLFGGCNYVAGSGTAMVTCGLSANITDSGNKVSVTNLKIMSHNQNSSHSTLENPKLLGIYGAI